MFDGFATASVDIGETTIFYRRAGSGPPLLLLHGFPETHVMWHRVAPVLADPEQNANETAAALGEFFQAR